MNRLLDCAKVRYFTGVGSRETPEDVGALMAAISMKLCAMGWTLRSGAADGADLAFESGARKNPERKQIFLPYKGFNGSESGLHHILPVCYEIASKVHPAWEKCGDFARKAHARNVFQVLGYNLRDPSALLICWTKDGALDRESAKNAGGTRTAIVLAAEHGVPVFNLQRDEHRELFTKWVGLELLQEARNSLVMKGVKKPGASTYSKNGAKRSATVSSAKGFRPSVKAASSVPVQQEEGAAAVVQREPAAPAQSEVSVPARKGFRR